MAAEDRISTTLRTVWHRNPERCEPIRHGPTSQAWLVTTDTGRYVAKLAPTAARRQFLAGLTAADRLHRDGMAIGAPVRAADGALIATLDCGVLGLLADVPGRPLDGRDPVDQQWWGDLLGGLHRALDGFSHPGLARWHWIRTDAVHLGVEPWVRPAVTRAVAEMTRLTVTDQLTYGVLHGDPAPEAFRMDLTTGRTGLVDWGSAATGPLVYDVAAAVIYAGGPEAARELLDGYAAAGPVPRDEIEAVLPTLLRFRYAVQADWCARLLAAGDATAKAGLDDARVLLRAA